MNTPDIITNQITDRKFPIVGIAVSASEIDSLQLILATLTPDSGMAYIIFEDLASQQHENLTGLLTAKTGIPIKEIVSSIEPHPDTIYVVPQGNFLHLEDGKLQLKPVTRSSRTNNCLDLFFDTLSQKYESYAVGLLLSWSVVDATAGLKKIKEYGGAAVSAVTKTGFSLAKGNADFIDYFTSPQQTAATLLEIKNSYIANQAYTENDLTTAEETIFNSIINLIVLKTGTHFHSYKPQTLRRRIAKRMVNTRQETAERYLSLLKNSPSEQELLFNDMLIPVTYFFRDPPFFDNLSSTVFPALIENLDGTELRIWSAGCSTGEEVYSLAICLDEFLQMTGNSHLQVKIFASDLSQRCIEKARAASYSFQDLKNIDDKRIEKYFTKRDSGFHLNKNIRDSCIFTIHDLTKDFPFSKIDFISCRNVLIYFNPELQNKVLAGFHYALKNNGFLFLGRSETAFNVPLLFDAVEKKEKIYHRKSTESQITPSTFPRDNNYKAHAESALAAPVEKDFRKIVANVLLEHYSPAAVLISEDFEIVHFHGDTSPFLQPAPGKPSFNIINMAHHELRFSLKKAILKTRNEKKNYTEDNIAVKEQSFLTSFEVAYLASNPELLLVTFRRKSIAELSNEYTNGKDNAKELLQLQGDFKQLSEEQQIYFEELQTTNEELLRRTDELQLLNEELEASAEELRSSVEELSCSNDELRDRRNQLWSMRNFYESIVKTIKEPLLIVDKNLIVHSANPSFYSFFKMKEEHTEGFSVSDLGNTSWNTPDFKETVLKKIRRNETVENVKIQFNAGGIHKKTVLVTVASIAESLPEGMLLIAFEDITNLEQGIESLRLKNRLLEKKSRQLENFTSEASHNLLDPVRKIYMFGKKIMDSESTLSEAGKHNATRLLTAASNLSQLIEDLISYAKVNFEQKNFKKTDLNSIIKKAVNDHKFIINERKAIIEIDAMPSLKFIPDQIQMLFSQLIANSLKFAKTDTRPEIKIQIQIPENHEYEMLGADPLKEYIKLSVTDNGAGFDKNFEKLIFSPFYRLESTETQYGTGLGLTMVQQIVSNHNGFIRASSKSGEGTSIFIYLPVEISFTANYSEN